jgi:hypothetical protein
LSLFFVYIFEIFLVVLRAGATLKVASGKLLTWFIST